MVYKTLKLRIKGNTKWLDVLAKEVNFVWNYCNDLSFKMIRDRGKFLSHIDINKYLAGYDGGLLNQMADSIDVKAQITIDFPYKIHTNDSTQWTEDEIRFCIEENSCNDNILRQLYEYLDKMLDRLDNCFCNDESLKIKYLGRSNG